MHPLQPTVRAGIPALAAALVPALVLLAAGCAGPAGSGRLPTPQDIARAAYESAEETFDGGNYLEATREFNEVRTRHPYSAYAALAELRLADCQFELGRYLESVEAYRAFVRFHPHHDRVPYAVFRVAESYFEEMPGDWFFMPPAYEKDQASTRDAVRALERFIERYPDTEWAPRAKEMLGFCRARLADHEMYVARFYLGRDEREAAAGRLEALAESFPDVGLAQDALLLLGRLYIDTGEPAKAGAALKRLVDRYPDGAGVPEARRLLESLPPAPPEIPQSES